MPKVRNLLHYAPSLSNFLRLLSPSFLLGCESRNCVCQMDTGVPFTLQTIFFMPRTQEGFTQYKCLPEYAEISLKSK